MQLNRSARRASWGMQLGAAARPSPPPRRAPAAAGVCAGLPASAQRCPAVQDRMVLVSLTWDTQVPFFCCIARHARGHQPAASRVLQPTGRPVAALGGRRRLSLQLCSLLSWGRRLLLLPLHQHELLHRRKGSCRQCCRARPPLWQLRRDDDKAASCWPRSRLACQLYPQQRGRLLLLLLDHSVRVRQLLLQRGQLRLLAQHNLLQLLGGSRRLARYARQLCRRRQRGTWGTAGSRCLLPRRRLSRGWESRRAAGAPPCRLPVPATAALAARLSSGVQPRWLALQHGCWHIASAGRGACCSRRRCCVVPRLSCRVHEAGSPAAACCMFRSDCRLDLGCDQRWDCCCRSAWCCLLHGRLLHAVVTRHINAAAGRGAASCRAAGGSGWPVAESQALGVAGACCLLLVVFLLPSMCREGRCCWCCCCRRPNIAISLALPLGARPLGKTAAAAATRRLERAL